MVGLVLKVRVLRSSPASTNHRGGEELHHLQSRPPQAERESHSSPFLLKRLPKPEQVRLVDIVPEIVARWAKLHPEEAELKIRKIYDDADPGTDIYDELSLAEIFVDEGKARHDHGCDQRATIQVIPWPTNSVGAIRPGSVVQDYHRIPKRGRQVTSAQVSSRLRRLSIVSEAEERDCEPIRPESARQSSEIPLPTVEPDNSVPIASNAAIFPNTPPASQDSCPSVNEAVRLRGPDVYSGEKLLRKRKRQQTPAPEQFTKRFRLQEDVANWRRSPCSSPTSHDDSDDDDGSQPENDCPRFRDPFEPKSSTHELSRAGETGSEIDSVGSDVDSPIILFSSRESSPAPLPDSNSAPEGPSSDPADDDPVIEVSSASISGPGRQRKPSPNNCVLNGISFPRNAREIKRLRKRANKEGRERIEIAESLNDKNLDPRLRRIYLDMSNAYQRFSCPQRTISRKNLKRLRKNLKAVKSTIASEMNDRLPPLAQSSVKAAPCSRASSINRDNSALPSPPREAFCPSPSVPPVELNDQIRPSSSGHSTSPSEASSPKVKIQSSPHKSGIKLTPQSSPARGQESRIGSTIQEQIDSYLGREERDLEYLRFQRAPRRLSIDSEGSIGSSGSSADSIDDSGDDSTYQEDGGPRAGIELSSEVPCMDLKKMLWDRQKATRASRSEERDAHPRVDDDNIDDHSSEEDASTSDGSDDGDGDDEERQQEPRRCLPSSPPSSRTQATVCVEIPVMPAQRPSSGSLATSIPTRSPAASGISPTVPLLGSSGSSSEALSALQSSPPPARPKSPSKIPLRSPARTPLTAPLGLSTSRTTPMAVPSTVLSTQTVNAHAQQKSGANMPARSPSREMPPPNRFGGWTTVNNPHRTAYN